MPEILRELGFNNLYMVAELLFKATKAWCEDNKICILLSDSKEIRFPVDLNLKLKNASFEQQNNIEIICNGTGLHWPDLDEDLSLSGIMEGRYSV
ncbi:MAG: DUF2442 domain-containing protein [Bacteroidota bacterium]